jgi:heavy metal sensor kinase
LREFVQPTSRGIVILVGRDIAADWAETQRLAGWLAGAGAGVLLLGLAGGWWLTTRALRPITDISATAVKIAAGDLSQRISVDSTETELGELAGVLNSTFSRLEAAFAQQVRFTSDAAHELRTPITVMLTQTQTALARERNAAEYRETLEACRRASVRMRKLIESLLELARLDSGQEPIGRATFDLAQIVAEAVENIRPIASERPVAITTQLTPAMCQGSPERIAQVVTNLLANAIHYNQENGKIQVIVEVQIGFASLTVTDTGLGIAPEDLPHIFERFYRADKARTRARGHAGLGLSISKAIAETHGGTLAAASELGKGSVFTLRLPLAKNSPMPSGTAVKT